VSSPRFSTIDGRRSARSRAEKCSRPHRNRHTANTCSRQRFARWW
jgi:hypothetical protein